MLAFIDFGIWSGLKYLSEIQSPWLYVGFLSIAFFSGVISGLLMMVIYQATAMNKLIGMASKNDSPILKMLKMAESMGSNNSGGFGGPPVDADGNLDTTKISGLVGGVLGMLTGGGGVPTSDKTDNLGLSKRRRRKKTTSADKS